MFNVIENNFKLKVNRKAMVDSVIKRKKMLFSSIVRNLDGDCNDFFANCCGCCNDACCGRDKNLYIDGIGDIGGFSSTPNQWSGFLCDVGIFANLTCGIAGPVEGVPICVYFALEWVDPPGFRVAVMEWNGKCDDDLVYTFTLEGDDGYSCPVTVYVNTNYPDPPDPP